MRYFHTRNITNNNSPHHEQSHISSPKFSKTHATKYTCLTSYNQHPNQKNIKVALIGIMMRTTIILLSISILLNSCTHPLASNCLQKSEQFISSVNIVIQQWETVNNIATKTPRSSLAIQIHTMEQLRQKAHNLRIPECSIILKKNLISSMDSTISGYQAFLDKKRRMRLTITLSLQTISSKYLTKI